ncbi:MAG: hypothetical protein FWC61_00050 [Proteobacteria bacterium]|nr:hypothetical protein [Pseudomonadota bacterium]
MKISELSVVCLSLLAMAAPFSVNAAAEPVQRRGAVAVTATPAPAAAAVTRGQALPPAASARSVAALPARSAAIQLPPQQTARSAARMVAAPQPANIAARAAVNQKVIQAGTGIAVANPNVIVDEQCRAKYFGCMDSFCMLENDSGGRCLCSDKKADLDKILTLIGQLDQQSYKMATEGVEKIDMGANADYIFKTAAKAEADAVSGSSSKFDIMNPVGQSPNRPQVNLAIFGTQSVSFDSMNTFGFDDVNYDLAGKTGDALRSGVNDICNAQMAGCESYMPMLQLMYTQNVASDCRAYENELNNRKNASAQKLATAQKALRDAALDSFQTANKYNLGQCTLRMIQCVKDNGCGEDFTGCVTMAAGNRAIDKATKTVPIKGANTSVTVAASTWDALDSKRNICFDTVTANCIAVKNGVWEATLREIAPAVRSAELIAESNIRMNCINSLSECFQKGCRDNFDPNNSDGSYDACLSRPEIIASVCKVQMDACTSVDSKIMDFVRARLSQMRGDACTAEARDCFLGDNACGKDFAQCWGLGLETIKMMCPLSKLTACNITETGQAVTTLDDESISQFLTGVFLSIDNAMIDQCQQIANAKMVEICGDINTCTAFDDNKSIGTESLATYKDANGNYIIDGLITFGAVTTGSSVATGTGASMSSTNTAQSVNTMPLDITGYLGQISSANSAVTTRIQQSLTSVDRAIQTKVLQLANDPKVSGCVNGRDTSQILNKTQQSNLKGASNARFPHLIDGFVQTIVSAGLSRAATNYSKAYNDMFTKVFAGQSAEIANAACYAMISGDKTALPFTQFDSATGSADAFVTSLTIPAAKVSQILGMNAKSTVNSVLKQGNKMVAKETRRATFSSATKVCTISTTTTACSTCTANSSGANVCTPAAGTGQRQADDAFSGDRCTTFMDPVTVEQTFQM